ncbi:sugar 3,4-ketoisomerase [Vibrio splendidus]|uniref:WxcM-like domain-containing protein n=1 Tax=Vibrio splendidus TaxID=29497 RepID=A0A2T5E6U7_VIBSP|nr:FdtA/QdtA family cupin domain-containing protein [Vibrio splendidus]OEE51106.1 dTDP-6-deoxy-3,4-keto-hexulose isomerase [Vibrio splendidus FF-6]PTP15039.1 WxcM-like domain-containing protein [Vibrio splendidus]
MNVQLIPLQSHGDSRGSLVSLETHKNIPFDIKRVYYIFDTEKNVERGFHAHKDLKQLAIVVSGSCRFRLDDGKERISVYLDNPSQGLYIDSCIWREMYDFSKDCVLVVLASNHYDEADYIRDYEQFTRYVNESSSK